MKSSAMYGLHIVVRRMVRQVLMLMFLLSLLSVTAYGLENDLVLNHDDSPDPVAAGGIVTYTVTVANDGSTTSINNVLMTDILPSGATYLSASPSQGSCSAPSGGQFTCSLGTLTPQATATVTVRVRSISSGTITNQASVTSTTGGFSDPQSANNSQNELTTVNAGANLALAMAVTPSGTVQSGSSLAYTLTITNAGPDGATNVQVVDTLPTGFVRTGSLPSGCSQTGQVVTCTVSGTIASGGSSIIGPINGTVTAPSGSSLTNSASVTITSPTAPQDPDSSDNTATLTTNVTAGCDLAISKAQSVANPVIQGSSFNYTLTVTSAGDNPANITVTDTVPSSLTVGSPTGTGWSCSATGQVVTCTRSAGIGSGSQTLPTITIPVTATGTGSVSNTATVASTTGDPATGNNTSNSVTTNVLAPNADMRANKYAYRTDGSSLSPALVQQGVAYRYRISMTNLGPSNATGGTLTITDTIPSGLTVDSYTALNGWSCTSAPITGPATIICTQTTNLAVNATSTYVEMSVTPTATGSLVNGVCVAATGGSVPADANSANDCASHTATSQNAATDLRLVKTASPDPANAGEILTYQLEVVNSSTVAATTVSLTDSLTNLITSTVGATGAGFIDAVVANNSASGGSCTSTASGGSTRNLSCSFTSIPQCTQGSNCPIITVRVRPRASGARTNSAYAVSADVVDANIADNTGSVTSSVSAMANVRTTIVDTPDPVRVGENITYVATIINDGPSDAANGVLNITLPEGVTFLSASPSAGACSTTPGANAVTTAGNKTVTCNLGTIALLGGQRTLTTVVRPTLAVSGSFPATVTAQSVASTTTTETDATNNSGSTTTQVTIASHDLLVNQTDSPDPVAVGDTITYTITLTNNGPSYATSVEAQDTLPLTRLTFVSATPSAGSCNPPSGSSLTCNVGDLAVGASKTITLVMTGAVKGVDSNSVTVSSAETRAGHTDTNIANNSVTEDSTVRTKADMEIVSKVAQTNPVGFRRPFNWVVTVRNNSGAGLAEADAVAVSDSLPSGMELTGTPVVTVTSGTFSTTTCTGSAGQTSFTCDLGTVSSGATGTITIPVRVVTYPSGGTMTNSMSVTTGSRDTVSTNNSNSGSVTILSSSLAGRVYRDQEDNGLFDGTDSGISGVVITLTGTAFDTTAVTRTATTAADGSYSVTQLPEGTYTLTEGAVAATGLVDGRETVGTIDSVTTGTAGNDTISAIVLGENKSGIVYLFGEIPASSISGRTYHDANSNGIADGGETGIAGVSITLTGIDDRGTPVTLTTTTAADGAYSFSGLRPGTYTITENQPASWDAGKTSAGTVIGTGSTPGAVTGTPISNSVQNIVLGPGGASSANNFGEIHFPTLSGYVFVDANSNGSREAGETAGITGVTVTLTGTDDLGAPVSVTTITAGNGSYSFTGLRPGSYTVTETAPAGLTHTGAEPGTAGGTGGVGSTVTAITSVSLASGTTATGYNFGESGQGLAGFVYVDVNNNGVMDSGEYGIPGASVTLSGLTAGGVNVCTAISPSPCTAVTDSTGAYNFTNIPASNGSGYTLTEQSQATLPLSAYADSTESVGNLGGTAGSDVITGIVLPTGGYAVGYNFGELGARLSGTVFHDSNTNGLVDSGEAGISGVTLTLSGTTLGGANICSVIPSCIIVTAADGSYSIPGLPAGTYTLTETQSVDFADGGVHPGSVGGTAGTNQISAITLTPGVSAPQYDFAERTGALSGFVYVDADNDGIKDSAESPIGGVTLILSGTTAAGVNVCTTIPSCTVTTAADGSYTFTGLRNANGSGYTIVETQPVAYLDGKVTAGTVNGTPCTTCNTATANRIAAIPFSAASTTVAFNFGELQAARVSGTVYQDSNNNGSIDPGEALGGVTLTLTGTDDQGNPVNLTVTTAADGSYLFPNLRPSDAAGYTLTETQPSGLADYPGAAGTQPGSTGGTPAQNRVTTIPVVSGTLADGYNFREHPASLSGQVYLDTNNNGVVDGGETGLSGVTVTLTGTDVNDASVSRTTATAADGSYAFSGLIGGTYTLSETHPVLYEDGRETAGSASGTVDNSSFSLNPAQNRITAITVPSGTDAVGYLFGERPALPATVSGVVWYNSVTPKDNFQEPGEPGLVGWRVEAVRAGAVIGSAITAADGTYTITGLPAGTGYELRFIHPNGALFGNPISQDSGYSDSVLDYSTHTIGNLTLRSGANIINQNLPLDPSGVVYDSVTRLPVSGATVVLSGPSGFNAAAHLLGGTANLSQVTDASGFYQFLLLPTAPAGTYSLTVTSPTGYVPGVSSILPVTPGAYTPGSGIIQNQAGPPTGSQATTYYLSFNLNSSSPNVINNHIPVDPILGGAITITKTTPLVHVTRGDLVPYTIEATNTLAATLPNIDLIDLLPPGFKYRSGSATIGGVKVEPVLSGRQLRWANQTFAPNEKKIIKLVLIVGSGVSDGEYTNQAWAINNIVSSQVSNVGKATVRIVPDPTFDCTDIIGKVFNDKNANGNQDDGEPGIANVRLATARGWLITTDSEGRYHIACAAIPQQDRGSNFIIKLDERTLPSGFRVTTENPRTVRATRGKMIKTNFGAAIHRVVRVEVDDQAFTGAGSELKTEWYKRFDDLPDLLRNEPSVVRLAYRVAPQGDRTLAKQRLENLAATLQQRWNALNCCYPLSIEQEIMEVSR